MHDLLHKAVANHQAGRLQTAAELYGMVLKHDNQNPDALHLMGVVAFQQGRHDQSVDLIMRAIKQDASQSAFYNNLGNTYNAMQKKERALACFKKAVEIDPDMADAHFNLANAYQQQGDVDDAIEHYQRADRLNPGCAQIYNNLGIAFNDKGMTDEAIIAYRSAIRIDPYCIDAYNNLCALQEGTSQLEAALETAREALRIDPESLLAQFNLAQINYRQQCYPEAMALLNNLLQKDLPVDLYPRAYYLLGKANNRMDRFDAAFESFSKANQYVFESDDFAAYRKQNADTIESIDKTGRFFTAEHIRHWRVIQKVSERVEPAFLVGFPRSGTTLIEQVLNAHSQMATLDEQPVFENVFRTFRQPVDGFERLDRLSSQEIARLRHSYLNQAINKFDNAESIRLIVDKLPLNILYLGIVYRFFPNAKIIVALRHPLGCVLSGFMQQFKMNKMMFNFLTVEGLARFYAAVMNLYLHYRQVLPLQMYQIRYEDVVDNFEKEMRGLFGFLGLEWQQRVLNYQDQAINRKISTPSYSQVVKPIYRDAAYRWMKYRLHLTPAIPWVEPFIHSFGYQ